MGVTFIHDSVASVKGRSDWFDLRMGSGTFIGTIIKIHNNDGSTTILGFVRSPERGVNIPIKDDGPDRELAEFQSMKEAARTIKERYLNKVKYTQERELSHG